MDLGRQISDKNIYKYIKKIFLPILCKVVDRE